MKRFTMILALALMVAMPMMAERVTPETARKAATTFLNNNGAKAAQLTDLSKAAGFPNLYIFTAEKGFVVMAADDCVQPILGYSLTGNFVAENMPENFRWWLQGYSDEIQFAIDSKTKATAETSKLWKDLIDGNSKAGKATPVVNNLLSTTWDQNPLYNNLCPYSNYYSQLTVTGCVATAMAQIMKYWGYPSNGIGSHSYTHTAYYDENGNYHDAMGELSADFGNTVYDWNNMPASLNSNSTNDQINAVATLMYHCGVSVEMDYGVIQIGGSGAVTAYVANALQTYFNYQTCTFRTKANYSENQWIQMLKDELDAGRPLQYSGRGTGGHSFVCCGYDSDNYFYFNWGWSGHNDAFYALNNLVPGSGGAGGGSYSFTNDQAAIFGIQPATLIEAPTNLTYTLSGQQDVTLNWDPASGASSYNVYRNGELVGNTTSTTFSETAPYGNNSYYVRALDSNGQQSLPSNTVTFTIDYPTPFVTDLTANLSGNNANLSWTAPEWCYPETPSATLTYGAESSNSSVGPGSTGGSFYWGNRHLANDLSEYDGKTLYKVSFYVNDPGAYECYIFKGTGTYSSYTYPSEEIAHFTTTASSTGWIDLDLDETIVIESSQDLWVFIYDPVGRAYPAVYSSFSQHTNGGYYSLHYPITSASGYLPSTFNNAAWLIKAYVTDGTYTYNLYQDGNPIAQNISETSYNANLNDNAANLFTVKTNYYGGETTASNAIGFAKGTASVDNLEMAANDQMTITEGNQLTVSGTMSNDNAENLIIENGAQLIHNSANVKATVKKTIQPYNPDGSDGWNFIASPVTESFEPSINNGLLTNNYDLYMFDQSQELEWRNIKAGSFSNIEHKTGYLYANSGNTTLTFAGTLVATTEPTVLAYDANASLKGFNLIGNPYPCNTTIANDFYIISNNVVNLAENGTTIAPCESVFVKATGTGESVTFTKSGTAKGSSSKDCFDLVIMQDKANTDRARVRLGEGIGMEKYTLNPDNTQISLRQDGQDFAVAYANGQDEMQLNFKAKRDGIYTLSIELGSLDLGYLHLIDNLTGNEINLLETPSYTFQATTSDYTSRFRLLFAPAEETDSTASDFAFFADGHLHVFNQGKARLQLIDMMGHILLTETLQGNLDMALDLVPGVYIVRLISEKTESNMKFVVD